MIDITATREMATANHPPKVIGALLIGYGTSADKDRSWLHQVSFALITSLAFYVIIDLEYPRLGLIRVDDADSQPDSGRFHVEIPTRPAQCRRAQGAPG